MCEFAGVKYEDVNWNDGSHLLIEIDKEQDDKFVQWFADRVRNDSKFRRSISKYPNLIKTKARSMSIALEFNNNFGFNVRKINNEEQKKLIVDIMKKDEEIGLYDKE